MRMSRRMGLIGGGSMPTMQELFGNATLVGKAYNSNVSSADGTFSVSLSGIDTSIPLYSIYLAGGSVEFAKIVGTTKTQLAAISRYADGSAIDPPRVVTVSSSEVASAPAYGGTICLVRFPSFPTAVIDKRLKQLAINDVTWRLGNSSSYIRTSYSNLTRTSAAVHIVFANQVDTGYKRYCFSISSGEQLLTLSTDSIPLFSTNAGSTTAGKIYLKDDSANSRYEVQWGNNSTVLVPIGGIYELTEA